MDGPAIENGALLIGDDGRIVAAGPGPAVPHPPGVPAEAFGDALLVPGFINTHTHLELTGMASGPPGPDFASWIRRLREDKAARSAGRFLEAARRGVAQCLAAGVTTVAEIGRAHV